jgi:general secretion pathway protein E
LASEFLGYRPNDDDFDFFKGEGCDSCSDTGYIGRKGLYEFLIINEALGRGISKGHDLIQLRKIAGKHGFQTMYIDGLEKVKNGITTFAEVMRVTRGEIYESL